ncbi:monocarboxylate transporter 9-like [Ylistrum balloti]|uniref:monocarboxylate transporter 9-like n=1 Tax=Ylistrum balloti TaxID=509963 RepID=UPI002905D373|nr:monocarboxylate transporter 9-like [Ylistrum balloti]
MSVPPDGGWGWVVAFSALILNFLIDGICFSFGVFFPDFLSYFGGSNGKTQLISSVVNGTTFLLGPFAGAAIKKSNCRNVAIFGTILSSVGLFLSTFSPDLDVMILLYGVVVGVGFGLVFTPSIVIISYYFDKRRAFATGLAVCGSGIGAFAVPPLSVVLVETYGWKGATWLLSGILLNGVVFSSFFRPHGSHCKEDSDSQSDLKENPRRKTICNIITDLLGCPVLTSPTFILFSGSCFLVSIGFFIPFNFLPIFAHDSKMSASEGALLISLIGISNTVSKVLIGKVSDQSWADCILINSVVLVIGGVVTCFVPYFRIFSILAAYSITFGVVTGTFSTLNAVITVELKGMENLPNAFGLLNLWIGIAMLFGSPIAGSLSDITGDYSVTFYYCGAAVGLGGLLCLLLRKVMRWEHSRYQNASGGQPQTQAGHVGQFWGQSQPAGPFPFPQRFGFNPMGLILMEFLGRLRSQSRRRWILRARAWQLDDAVHLSPGCSDIDPPESPDDDPTGEESSRWEDGPDAAEAEAQHALSGIRALRADVSRILGLEVCPPPSASSIPESTTLLGSLVAPRASGQSDQSLQKGTIVSSALGTVRAQVLKKNSSSTRTPGFAGLQLGDGDLSEASVNDYATHDGQLAPQPARLLGLYPVRGSAFFCTE